MPSNKVAKAEPVLRKKATFFTNDFSNAADWTMGNNSGNSDNWVVGTTVPSGTFPMAGISSTTAANGFGLYDSDLMCSGDQSGWLQLAAPINCTGHTSVAIDFEQSFRMWQAETFVQVSTDGMTWTDFQVNQDITTNNSTPDPELKSVNITSVAANQATVYIRFYYLSGPGNGFDGCGYAWMVDDMALRDLDDFDLRLRGAYWGSEGYWGARLPYTMVPSSQIAPVKFSGIVENAGAQSQTGVTFAATSGTYNGLSAAAALATSAIDTLDALTDFTPASTLGQSTVNMGVASLNTDAVPADNTGSQVIEVTGQVYARDMNAVDGGSFNSGQGFEVGNIFDIYGADVATGATVYIAGTANPGAQIYSRLYFIDPATGDFTFAVESDLHTVTAGELDTYVSLPFQSTYALLADSGYLVVVGSYGDGGATNDLVVGTSGTSEAQTTFYFDQTDQTWYYTTSTPMVRLNMVGTAGLTENAALSSLNIYPNPATDKVSMEYDLKNESNVEITITDMTGKVVYSSKLGSQAAGKHAVSVNTNNMTNGIYVVNIATNNAVSTQKLVIRK